MKQLFSILLAILIFVLATKDVGTYLAFKVNQTFIANNWCVNINTPEANCCGKCFLKNELKSNQEGEQESNNPLVLEEKAEHSYYTNISSTLSNKTRQKPNNNFDYYFLEGQLFTYNFLDPPEIGLS